MAFFFSSRRRHTRYIGDWSSDVCSSDLAVRARQPAIVVAEHVLALVGRQLLDECAPGFRKHARHAVHEPVDFAEGGEKYKIGRASCRERGEIRVVDGGWKRKTRGAQGGA